MSVYDPKRTFVTPRWRAQPGSLAGLRLRFEHTRLSYAIHQLGNVLIAQVPQVVPGLEAFGRPARDIREQLAPVFLRFLLAAELAIRRDVFDVGVNRLLVRVEAAKLERAFVVALQVIIVEERMVIPPRAASALSAFAFSANATPRSHCPESAIMQARVAKISAS